MRKQITDFATKALKKQFMQTNSSNSQKSGKSDKARHADTVIRNHVIWSMGASYLIPLPIADIFAVSALQLDMIRQLCRVYDIDFAETQGKALVSTLTTSTMARAGARSLIKLVPGIGTLIGGVTVSVFNGASTFALGEVFKKHFEMGGTFLDFDVERLKKVYNDKFEKGKKVAEQWKSEKPAEPTTTTTTTTASPTPTPEAQPAATTTQATAAPDKAASTQSILDRLRELGDLRAQGIITDAEFEAMKKQLIEGFSA